MSCFCMTEQLDINRKIFAGLARLQADIDYLKAQLRQSRDQSLEEEMAEWEEAGAHDAAEFFQNHNL